MLRLHNPPKRPGDVPLFIVMASGEAPNGDTLFKLVAFETIDPSDPDAGDEASVEDTAGDFEAETGIGCGVMKLEDLGDTAIFDPPLNPDAAGSWIEHQRLKKTYGITAKTQHAAWLKWKGKHVSKNPGSGKAFSAATSIPQVAAVFKRVAWRPGTVNLDVGGGRFNYGTECLATFGVKNLVYDPGNRTTAWNKAILSEVKKRKADTVTVSNVLNVIPCADARAGVVKFAAQNLRKDGTAFFTVYYASGKKAGPTPKGWQEQRPLRTYVPEVEKHFGDVQVKGDVIYAREPKRTK
jgi:hypothetical protein